jgi:hypothetical protein
VGFSETADDHFTGVELTPNIIDTCIYVAQPVAVAGGAYKACAWNRLLNISAVLNFDPSLLLLLLLLQHTTVLSQKQTKIVVFSFIKKKRNQP